MCCPGLGIVAVAMTKTARQSTGRTMIQISFPLIVCTLESLPLTLVSVPTELRIGTADASCCAPDRLR